MDKQYNHQIHEAQMQQKWHQEQTYSAENNPGPLYSIDTPPPTVSGSLHIGHIFSYTQTDIIARYKRMNGFSVFYPFGFDDNGLPTERFVEKKRNISAHNFSRSDFIKICLEETVVVEQQFQDLWQKIGLSVDWNACYSTISDQTRKISQESFIRLFKKGFIYRAYEPALYCTTCRTSVAQAELEDSEQASFFNDIIFTLEDGTRLSVGTTRPELLASCVALLYNPNDTRYQQLKGKKARVPYFNYEVPILADDQVVMDKGTGLVMVCTFGDKTDITWFKKFNLPYKPSIGKDGRWLPETGILAGLKVQQARAKIIEALKELNLLTNQKPITHAVNIHERCKHEIEYLALSQWFLNIIDHKKTFLELAEKIAWYPTFMKSRYINWVENISWNWCLSRQRFFGIPFPAWHCQSCNEILLPDIKDLPLDPQEIPYKGTCPKCSSNDIVPDTDVMDTWNTSSLTPYICYSLFDKTIESVFTEKATKQFIPMSMRPQAHDIIRTWAFDTIVKVWMHHETIPWHDIIISGHVLSDAKEKISKSKGNTKTDPEQLLKTYPADVIRYWTASGSLGHDTAFSETQLKIGQKLLTKLWNAFRFIAEHTSDITSNDQPQNIGVVNEWILHQATQCFDEYRRHFDGHEFNHALDVVEKFFWHNVCDNYLELIKDQLFKPENYAADYVRASRWTLSTIGLRLLQLYAPYLPHITETIYQHLYRSREKYASIHQTQFEIIQKPYLFAQSASTLHVLIEIASNVRKLKTEQQLSLKTELKQLEITASYQAILDQLKQEEQLIKGVTQARTIIYSLGVGSSSSLKKIDDNLVATIYCNT